MNKIKNSMSLNLVAALAIFVVAPFGTRTNAKEFFAFFSSKTGEPFLKPVSREESEHLKEICGRTAMKHAQIDFKVIGGQSAVAGQFPWAVSFAALRNSSKNEGMYGVNKCGGTLISRRHILTAAHCLIQIHAKNKHICNRATLDLESQLAEDVGIMYGGVCLSTNSAQGCPARDMKMAKVAKVALPLEFLVGECKKGLDFAILELVEDLEFDQWTTMPICLPPTEMPKNAAFEDSLIDMGWGISGGTSANPERSAKLRFFASQLLRFPAGFPASGHDNLIITNGTDHHPIAGICPGDSGAPLQATFAEPKRTFLIGIHSKSVLCYQKNGSVLTDGPHHQASTFVPKIVHKVCEITGVCPSTLRRSSIEG